MEFKDTKTVFENGKVFADRAGDFLRFAENEFSEEERDPGQRERILRQIFKNQSRRGRYVYKRQNLDTKREIQMKKEVRGNEHSMAKGYSSYVDTKEHEGLFKDGDGRAGAKKTAVAKKDPGREDYKDAYAKEAPGDGPKAPDGDTKKAAQKAQVKNIIKSGKLKVKDGGAGREDKQIIYDNPPAADKEKGLIKTAGIVFASNLTIVIILMIAVMALIPVTLGAFVSIDVVTRSVERMLGGFPSRGQILSQGSLSEEEIDEIIAGCGVSAEKEPVIRFALSKVGFPYSQALRTSGSAFDCSSLAYYSCLNGGSDISYGAGYPPTAATMASKIYSNGTVVSSTTADGSMQPGDLIFYGGKDNGRYMGIYHVAIYLGNGKVVEALNERYGVVYGTLRTKNAILVLRP